MTETFKYFLRNAISPSGLALLSYALFLATWALPSKIYEAYIGEPDLIFFEPRCLFFVTMCVLAFLVGARLSGNEAASIVHRPEAAKLSASAPLRVLLAPILLFTVYCLLAIRSLNSTFNVYALLLSQQGNDIKEIIGAQGLGQRLWDYSINLLMATLWWASVRGAQFGLERRKKGAFWFIFWCGAAVAVMTAVARADRTILTAFIIGTGITYLYRRVYIEHARLSHAVAAAVCLVAAVVASFILLAFFRGAATTQLLIYALLSYAIAPYNRLAALLLGIMHYTYQGSGVYLVRYISQMNNNSFLSWIPHILGLPDPLTVWRSEFLSVGSAGLIPGLNWSSTFGYVFSDLGWWSPVYFLVLGLLSGWVWVRFLQDKLFALIIYPWFGFWILFWAGWNCIFDYQLVGLLEAAALLWLYERVFIRRVTAENEQDSKSHKLPPARAFSVS